MTRWILPLVLGASSLFGQNIDSSRIRFLQSRTYPAGTIGVKAQQYLVDGVNNVIVGGVPILPLLTSGQGNVCMGNQTCQSITTGNENVAMGYAAGQQWDVCGASVAIGRSALQREHGFPCGSNTAVGYSSSTQITNGNENTALGYFTLKAATGNSGNTAIGAYALQYSLVDAEVAVGYTALGQATTGTGNTAIGYGAMSTLTTGGSNASLGGQALAGVLTGNFNTAVGQQAGNLTHPVTTGSNNTHIGYGTAFGDVSQHNYQTVIGSGATGTCSNCVVLGRIGSDYVLPGLMPVAANNAAAIAAGVPVGGLYRSGADPDVVSVVH